MYNDIDLAIRRLPTWMKNEGRMRDSMMFYKPFREWEPAIKHRRFMDNKSDGAGPKVMRQPKGVALVCHPVCHITIADGKIISPWVRLC